MKKTIQILKELRDSNESIKFAENFCNLSDDEKERLRESEKALDDAIKALESSSWIPVSERLPEINVDVIVTDIETTGTYSSYYLGDGFWECDNGTHKNRIIAWMPLPQPYTMEDADT